MLAGNVTEAFGLADVFRGPGTKLRQVGLGEFFECSPMRISTNGQG